MNTDTWHKGFKRCPTIVQDYLLDPASGENEDKAQALLAIENDAWDRLSDPAWRLVFDGMTKEEFRLSIKKVSGEHNPDEVERVLLQQIVYPMADLISWDVEARLQELGVPSADLQTAFRISLRPMSYGVAARRIATNANLSVLTEEVARRLREILISFLKGVRSFDEVKGALQQPQAEGGVGFSSEQAERYVEEIEKLQLSVGILSEEEYANWYANFQREANVRLMEQAAKPIDPASLDTGTDQDPLAVRQGSDTYDVMLERVVDETLKKLTVTGLDEYLTKRLRNVISSRLRDVRNAIQVKEILVRDAKVGGVELHPEEAEVIAGVIEAAYQMHRAELAASEKGKIDEMRLAQDEKRVVRRKQESEEHAEWYRQKIQTANPWAAAIKAERAGTSPAPSTSSSPMTPTLDGIRPSLDGIRPPTRLTSLGDELGRMTLAEFRRTAKTPEESMERLWQKLETLKQDSYERWSEGAQAWRQSPLQQQYLQLVTESFTSGRPVAEVAQTRHEQDPGQPTSEEIGAILLLNNRLNV